MKLKRAVKTFISCLLILLMLVPSQLTAFAGTVKESGTGTQAETQTSADVLMKNLDAFGLADLDTLLATGELQRDNRILGSTTYDSTKGTATVNYHGDGEGIYTFSNYPDAAATLKVSLYEENEANDTALINETAFDSSTKLAEGNADGVALSDDSATWDVYMVPTGASLPTYFYMETEYTLYVEGVAVLCEKQRTDSYTEAYITFNNSKLADFFDGTTQYDTAHAENFDTASGNNSTQFAIYKATAAIIDGSNEYNVTVNENTYTLDKVPAEFTDEHAYTAEELKSVSELVFAGEVTTDAAGTVTKITTATDGEKHPVPLAKDAAGNYLLEYVYAEGTTENPIGIRFTVNTEATFDDIYDHLKCRITTDDTSTITIADGEAGKTTITDSASNGEQKIIDRKNVTGTVKQDVFFIYDIQRSGLKIQHVSIETSTNGYYDLTFSGDVEEFSFVGDEQNILKRTFEQKVHSTFLIKSKGKGHIKGVLCAQTRNYRERGESADYSYKLWDDLQDFSPDSSLTCTLGAGTYTRIQCNTLILKKTYLDAEIKSAGTITYDGRVESDQFDGVTVHTCVGDHKGGCIGLNKTTEGNMEFCISLFGKKTGGTYIKGTDTLPYYKSFEYNDPETGFASGYCPHRGPVTIKADKDSGVYNEESIQVALSTWADGKSYTGPNLEIFYTLDGGEAEKYTKGQPITITRTEDQYVHEIVAWVQSGDAKGEEQIFDYMLITENVLIIPGEMTLDKNEEGTIIFLHTENLDQQAAFTAENDSADITISKVTTVMPGFDYVTVKSSVPRTYQIKAKAGESTSAICNVKVSDNLGLVSARTGSGLYFLREISVSGMGEYKDRNIPESEEQYPYIYHNGSHTLAEQLSYSGSESENVDIYYTTDGSTPTVASNLYTGGNIYLYPIGYEETAGVYVKTIKAVAYNRVTGQMGDVVTWRYVIVDTLKPSGEATTIVLPSSMRLYRGEIGVINAAYIPRLSDIINPLNWTISGGIPCFKVNWRWKSENISKALVIGTTELITRPTIHVDLFQVGIIIALKKTDNKAIKAKAIASIGMKYISEKSKAEGFCKVIIDPAKPDPDQYVIHYDLNGGEGSFEDQKKNKGETLKLNTGKPNREGYTFQGWARSAYAAEPEYQPGDDFKRDENTTLYAVWKADTKKYTITYDANGGTNAPAKGTKEQGKTYYITQDKPTRTGYNFNGWALTPNGVNEYFPGNAYTEDKNITLYACWIKDKNEQIITYHGTGGTNVPEPQSMRKGESFTVSSKIPVKAAFKFEGWCSYIYGTVPDYFPGISYAQDGDLDLYAIWTKKANCYRIEYDANGGEGAPEAQEKKEDLPAILSEIEPTREGYTFLGWSLDKYAETAEYAPTDIYIINADTILYAVWQRHDFTCVITYDANGGVNAPKSQAAIKNTKIYLRQEIPAREGYEFAGWSEDKNAINATYQAGEEVKVTRDLTLYAVWKNEYRYSLSYDANGGEGAPAAQSQLRNLYTKISSVCPTRPGYTFIGWSEDRGAKKAEYQPEDKIKMTGNIVLYAIWSRTPGKYIVSYDANGGTGAPYDQEKQRGADLTLSWDEPVRSGYVFIGWSENKTATSSQYRPGDVYTKNADLKLYAVWNLRSDSYCIHYDANGGTNAPNEQFKEKGQTIKITSDKPVRTGYAFKGWALSADSTTVAYKPGDNYEADENLILFAVWERNTSEFICEYDANGGTGAPETQYFGASGYLTISKQRPLRDGYEFLGWSEQKDAKTASYMPGQQCQPLKDIRLYAVWNYVGYQHRLTVINGKTSEGKTEDFFYSGSRVTVIADDDSEGLHFAFWQVNSGNLKLTDEQKSSRRMTFTMPASDVEIEAVYMDTPISPYNAEVKHGTLNGIKGTTVFYAGTEITAAASVAGSLTFDHWEATGLTLTDKELHSEVFTFTMPDNDIKLEAKYVKAPSAIYSVMTTNGTIVGAIGDGHQRNFVSGQTVYVEAADKPEDVDDSSNIIKYYFQRWVVVSGNLNLTEEQATSKNMSFTMPDDDIVLVAEFRTIYEKPLLQVVKGSITSGTYKGKTCGEYDPDDVVEVTARASGSLVFVQWNAVGMTLTEKQRTSSTMKIKMPDNNVILTAEYTTAVIEPHDVIVVEGTITGTKEHIHTYQQGSSVSVTASIAGGKTFDHWFAKGLTLTEAESKQDPLQFTMPDNDVTLVAMYQNAPSLQQPLYVILGKVKKDALLLGAQSNGYDFGEYWPGANITVNADFAAGMVFDHWESDGIELTEEQKTSQTMTFTMPDTAAALAAVYVPSTIEPHRLLVDYGAIVEGDELLSQGSYFEGSQIRVRADFIEGAVFDHWRTIGITLTEEELKEPELLITMPDNDAELIAVYTSSEIRPHVLKTVDATFNGGKTEWDYYVGTKVKAKADSIVGKRFVKWEVTKGTLELTAEQKKQEKITFTMPDEDLELTAVFEKLPETGDRNKLFTYLGLFSLALMGIAFCVVFMRRVNGDGSH